MESRDGLLPPSCQQMKPDSPLFVKALGYHAFNLHALAMLKAQYPHHASWGSARFHATWRYACSAEYRKLLDGNPYGYPYNPPGIEMAYALEVFGGGDRRKEQERWLAEQMRRCYDEESGMMARGTEDPRTHAARLYEATRLPDLGVTPTGT